jgi:hypothetical protein
MKVNELQVGMIIFDGDGQSRVEAVAHDWAIIRDIDGHIQLIELPEEFELYNPNPEEQALSDDADREMVGDDAFFLENIRHK